MSGGIIDTLFPELRRQVSILDYSYFLSAGCCYPLMDRLLFVLMSRHHEYSLATKTDRGFLSTENSDCSKERRMLIQCSAKS